MVAPVAVTDFKVKFVGGKGSVDTDNVLEAALISPEELWATTEYV